MDVARRVLFHMPEAWLRRLIEGKFKDGSAFELPVFDMLLRSLETFGGKRDELEAALASPAARKQGLPEIFRELGSRLVREAASAEEGGRGDEAREAYRRASVYFLAGDWFGTDLDVMAANYALMLPAFDAYRRLCDPPVEKLSFAQGRGRIYAHLRLPKEKGKHPALILVQGNDDVKEFNTRLEEVAVAQGFAVLDLDPPGWGESLLGGTVTRGRSDYREALGLAVDHLSGRPDVDAGRIGVAGFSFGGLLAPYAAGLEPRIGAAAGLGGPSYRASSWRALRRDIPPMQRNRSFLYSGTRDESSMYDWMLAMEFEAALREGRSPVLLVHGAEDVLVPPSAALDNASLMGERAELRLVAGGDHMCNASLLGRTAPAMFDWIRERLDARCVPKG